MKIYIDNEKRCHTTNPDCSFREVEHPFFDEMCPKVIECYRYVPKGESWERSDGNVFYGEMISLCKDSNELDAAQQEYWREKLSEYEALIDELYAEVTAE